MASILGKALKGAAEVAVPAAFQISKDRAVQERDARLQEYQSQVRQEDALVRTAEMEDTQSYNTDAREDEQKFKAKEAALERASREKTSRRGGGDLTAKQKDARSLVAAGVFDSEKDALEFVHQRGSISETDIFKLLSSRQADKSPDFDEDYMSAEDIAREAKSLHNKINSDNSADSDIPFPKVEGNENRVWVFGGKRYKAGPQGWEVIK